MFADIVTEPSLQSACPLQPAKVEPAAAVAVSVTAVPCAKSALQVAPHETPEGALVMLPLPVPVVDTVSVYFGTGAVLNVAVQVRAAVMVTDPSAQSALPLQPANVEPADGLAVSVTAVSSVKPALQVEPQAIPLGALDTLPEPVPARWTASVC
jgi:hypothetical protein